MSFEKEI